MIRLVVVWTGIILGLSWFGVPVQAQEAPRKPEAVLAYHPPQASAEAFLRLPTVYVLPGSFLYWLKHAYEQFQLILTADPTSRSQLLLDLSQERLAEGYQAMKEGKWSSAVSAFHEYQDHQAEITGLLTEVQNHSEDVQPILNRLKQQLQLQQSLKQIGEKVAPNSTKQKISLLLEISHQQTLALAQFEQGALLGVKTVRQSSESAQLSPSPGASASATPSARPH